MLSILNLRMLGIKSKRGLSLVEVLVVVAMISILSSIAYISYDVYQERARRLDARKTLTSIILATDIFRANTGFYLPNLKEMGINISGTHNYHFRVFCTDDSGASSWNSGSVCGDFEPAVNSTTKAEAKCWMGYVTYYTFSGESGDFPYPVDATNSLFGFECGATVGTNAIALDYVNRTEPYKGVFSFDYDGFHNNATRDTTKTEMSEYFKLKDTTDTDLCAVLSSDQDLYSTDKSCIIYSNYAIDKSIHEDIIEEIKTARSEVDADFLSSPNRMVINAYSCSKRDSDECGDGNLKDQDYSFIRFDSRKILLEYKGRKSL